MQAVILAAGRGTRMGTLTEHLPKPLVEVAGKTLLEHKFDALPSDVSEIILVVHYLGDMIRERFGDSYKGVRVTYVEQDTLDGTGGALWRAKDMLEGRFIVMMGDDVYSREDMSRISTSPDWALLVEERALREKGKVTLRPDGSIDAIEEGNHGGEVGLAGTNLFALDTRVFDEPLVPKAPGSNEFGLPQTVLAAAKRLHIPLHPIRTTAWIEMTSPEDVVKTEKLLAV